MNLVLYAHSVVQMGESCANVIRGGDTYSRAGHCRERSTVREGSTWQIVGVIDITVIVDQSRCTKTRIFGPFLAVGKCLVEWLCVVVSCIFPATTWWSRYVQGMKVWRFEAACNADATD